MPHREIPHGHRRIRHHGAHHHDRLHHHKGRVSTCQSRQVPSPIPPRPPPKPPRPPPRPPPKPPRSPPMRRIQSSLVCAPAGKRPVRIYQSPFSRNVGWDKEILGPLVSPSKRDQPIFALWRRVAGGPGYAQGGTPLIDDQTSRECRTGSTCASWWTRCWELTATSFPTSQAILASNFMMSRYAGEPCRLTNVFLPPAVLRCVNTI